MQVRPFAAATVCREALADIRLRRSSRSGRDIIHRALLLLMVKDWCREVKARWENGEDLERVEQSILSSWPSVCHCPALYSLDHRAAPCDQHTLRGNAWRCVP